MKLYYAPGACSLAVHIVLREMEVPAELTRVDLATHRTADGTDYTAVNSKGYVPALVLADGTMLTEVAAIVQYLADRQPATGLAPRFGSMQRYQLMEMLNFISAEIHKGFAPLWDRNLPGDARQATKKRLATRLAWLEGHLGGRDFLFGSRFTVADAYAFAVLGWAGPLGVELSSYPMIGAYLQRVAVRPAVIEALRYEGLGQQAA